MVMNFRMMALGLSLAGAAAGFSASDLNAPLPRKGMLGAAVGPVSVEKQKQTRLPASEGLEVTRLIPGGSAEALGLMVGDVLVSVGKTKVGEKNPLPTVISRYYANQPIELKVVRDGKTIDLRGTLKERPRQTSDEFVVEYSQVVSRGKRIRVITTRPKGEGKFPTVFLIGGIGAYSVDGNFNTIAYGNVMGPVANAGFATVRIDKPGQGDSEGPAYSDLRFGDEQDAYLQAIRYAKKLPYIDPNRIAIFGQSMGGTFGPLIAAQEPVAGLAVHGTLAKSWVEYWVENVRRQSALAGASAADIDAEQKKLSALNTFLFYEKQMPSQIIRRHPEMKKFVEEQIPDGKTLSGVGIPFFQELADQNLMKAWSEVKAPVLVLYGENDFISTRWDHEYIVDTLNQKSPGSATLRVLEQSDHGFFQTTSPRDSMEKWGKGSPHNPNVEEALIDWLRKTLKVN
jgi:alpha-beta hydrolase superfamily lysophospholipase